MAQPTLPASISAINPREWETFQPFFEELLTRTVTDQNRRQWLADWSDLTCLISEAVSLIYIEKSLDTADTEKEQAFLDLINDVLPPAKVADQKLKERLLQMDHNGRDMADMGLVIRNLQNEADLFREENIPIQTELAELENEYDKITGGLKAEWNGEEKNLNQLQVYLKDKDRETRRRAFELISQLWLSKRASLNHIYSEMLTRRQQMALNASLPDFRAYAFRQMRRFDYTPEACFAFHEAIEKVAVPATRRIIARRRERLELDQIRPWDWIPERSLLLDAWDAPPLKPYNGQDELIQGSLKLFGQLDPELGRYFATMAEENLLDLDTRPGKALGGYCDMLPLRRRPFIFMNGTGLQGDVETMLHEAGHAFHVFEESDLPFIWQWEPPMEFCEVASMGMELLAAPYLVKEKGGFYTPVEAARARIEHLESFIIFLPYMAVVDSFQHWVYSNPEAAKDAANCDAVWDKLWLRYLPDIDWTGYEDARKTGWHRKPHIFSSPFYYIEYGMASIGALQVWQNSLHNQAEALAKYRKALSLGGTKTLPELFEAAGAEFRFDVDMLSHLLNLVEQKMEDLAAQM